jgi:uncharacterized OB-fold protein
MQDRSTNSVQELRRPPENSGGTPDQVPIVEYLVLGDEPHLQSWKCTQCEALYFDRRNACAKCFDTEFTRIRLSNQGTVRAYTIVHRAAPNVPAPYTSVVVELEGGGIVKSNLVSTTDPTLIQPGLGVELTTFRVGTDDNGTAAVAFGYKIKESN